jgi:hypothetical protein
MHETQWLYARREQAVLAARVPSIFASAGWRTSIATRTEQMLAAEELVRRRYAWRGYRVAAAPPESDQGLRIVLLAQNAGKLMGTLTVRPDSPQGLNAEATYAEEIHQLRLSGHRLGEIGRLALEEGADSRRALDALVQSAYLVTHVVHALTDVVIEINPRHVRFYERVLGFVVTATERFCDRVGAPSVLLRLDLAAFGRRLQLAA